MSYLVYFFKKKRLDKFFKVRNNTGMFTVFTYPQNCLTSTTKEVDSAGLLCVPLISVLGSQAELSLKLPI